MYLQASFVLVGVKFFLSLFKALCCVDGFIIKKNTREESETKLYVNGVDVIKK